MELAAPECIRGMNIGDLIEHLKGLHEKLAEIQQCDLDLSKSKLNKVATRLVHAELLKHSDKNVKTLVCCCLANILRLFAPDAPYNPVELRDIFSVIIHQIRCLADDKYVYTNHINYLVESLATVKSIVLLLDIDDADGSREKLLRSIFTLIFDLAPQSHISKTTKLYLLDILQTLINEGDGLPVEVLRILLARCRDKWDATRVFAGELVRVCADKLQPSLGMFFNEHLLHYTTSEGKNDTRRMEALKQIHSQLMNIGCVAPEAVSSVVAQLEDELQTDDLELRCLAIDSVAELLTTPEKEIGRIYPSLWRVWLSKMDDKNVAVRIHWIKVVVCILNAASLSVLQELQRCLLDKLQDIDARVREKALGLLKEHLDEGKSPILFGSSLCEEIGNRCRDRNPDVRKKGIVLLCEIIHNLYSYDSHNSLFSLCCNALLKLIYTKERELQLLFEYFIEQKLMISREGVSMEDHAKFVNSIYGSLDEDGHKAFKKWLQDKAYFVKFFDAYLKVCSQLNDTRLATIIQHLASLFCSPLEAQQTLKAMAETILKNKSTRDTFTILNSSNAPLGKIERAIRWINETDFSLKDARVRTSVTTYIAYRASYFSVNSSMVTAILAISTEEPFGSAKRLAGLFISEFPSLAIQHVGMLEDFICKGRDIDRTEQLKSYAALISASPGQIEANPKVLDALWEVIEKGSRKNVKLAVRILLHFPDTKKLFTEIIETTTLELELYKCQNIIRSVQVLCELAKNINFARKLIEKISKIAKKLVDAEALGGAKSMTICKLDSLDEKEAGLVLILKCLKHAILALRAVDKAEELNHLRVLAPQLVEWMCRLESTVLKLSLAKTLITLVPRPTATTILENLSPILVFMQSASCFARQQLNTMICKNYQSGVIGIIYMALSVISTCGIAKERARLKETICSIRKNDRFAEPLLPLDTGVHEINSRGLRRYEDWFIIILILASLYPNHDDLDGETLKRYSDMVDFLVDILATDINVSFLFDAAVQLKRIVFADAHVKRSKHLYVLSELTQNALRSAASHHKWLLQAVKRPISITDDLVHEIIGVEEMGKNIQKSYLLKIAKAGKQRADHAKSTVEQLEHLPLTKPTPSKRSTPLRRSPALTGMPPFQLFVLLNTF